MLLPPRLPVAMSKIPTVTERLQMTERNILNRLLAARNMENGDKAASSIIPGENGDKAASSIIPGEAEIEIMYISFIVLNILHSVKFL